MKKIKIGNVLLKQGDVHRALLAYQGSLVIAEALTEEDAENTEWQRDLFISNIKIGDVLMKQGKGPEALVNYQAALTIAERLAKRDTANTDWQLDVSYSCSKLGTMDQQLPVSTRRSYLQRGREILLSQKHAVCQQTDGLVRWFDQQIRKLDGT